MKCFLCETNENILVKKYKYWTVLLHKNQYYLGRCMVKLNRHTIDLFDISNEERGELFAVVKNLRDVLKKLFNPNLFNYASLGNTVNHLHLHVIPRYKEGRVFEGKKFVDERWGRNYAPYPKDFETPSPVLMKLKSLLKENLK